MTNSNLRRTLLIGVAAASLGGCGANDIASPGTGGNITINNPPAAPAPTPTPTPTATLISAAPGCPTIADVQGLTNDGTISGPTGAYRVCTLPARINTSITLPAITGLAYRMNGRVDVGTDRGNTTTGTTTVVLTVAAGALLFGESGPSWLAVNRGNSIQAVGTATRPIIFTSRDNIQGLNTDSSSGQWGGVVLLGRGQTTDCAAPAAAPGTNACERQTEGAVDPALFGGTSNTESSGRMSYVQIRNSGYILSNNVELQALTTGGIGSGTTLDHIQSVNSSDDGAEFFGGRVNLRYLISVGAEDDNLDTDTGTKANFQYVIVAQRSGIGDSIIEADTDNSLQGNLPRQNTQVSNFVFIQRSTNSSSNQASIFLRGSTDYALVNGIVVSPANSCLRISQAQTASATVDAAIDELGAPFFRSVALQCSATPFIGSNGVTATDVMNIFGAATAANNNNATFTPTLTNGYVNGANETAVTAFNAATLTANGAFFDTTTYIGAVRDAADTWYTGWTCNSAAASFGTGNTGLCTSLPTS